MPSKLSILACHRYSSTQTCGKTRSNYVKYYDNQATKQYHDDESNKHNDNNYNNQHNYHHHEHHREAQAPRCPHAFERCVRETPALLPLRGVRVACHAVEESKIPSADAEEELL